MQPSLANTSLADERCGRLPRETQSQMTDKPKPIWWRGWPSSSGGGIPSAHRLLLPLLASRLGIRRNQDVPNTDGSTRTHCHLTVNKIGGLPSEAGVGVTWSGFRG
jgi:hypothetical protein